MTDQTSPILTARGLAKSFTTGQIVTKVLKDVDLDLYAGEFTLLMGPSGSGKSTLLAGISGLQKPDAGTVIANGYNLWEKPKKIHDFRLKYCGFIFQNVNLFSCLTALQQVVFLLEHIGIDSKKANMIAEENLEAVGLSHRMNLLPNELSGGEKQRVAIARTLATKPKLIFADEPTSDLDSVNGQMIVDLLHRASREQGAMVLCVTHDDRVKKVADRTMFIEDGIITNGEKKD